MKDLLSIKYDFRKINRINDYDLLSQFLFPLNKNHRKIFLAIIIEMKWSSESIIPNLEFVRRKYNFSLRSFQRCRAKMNNAGIIEYINRFSNKAGHQTGWAISSRFSNSLNLLAEINNNLKIKKDNSQKEKDIFLINLY